MNIQDLCFQTLQEDSHTVGSKVMQMSIEEAFKNRVSFEKPEKQASAAERETAAEPHKSKETEDLPQGHAEEYTELPIHALAHESMFTDFPTGRYYLHLKTIELKSTSCLLMYFILPPHEMCILPFCLFSYNRLISE